MMSSGNTAWDFFPAPGVARFNFTWWMRPIVAADAAPLSPAAANSE
jgi:hypothetical protein